MCKELADRFQRTISRKKVYTYLTKTLKYSYKRNNYKAQYSFEPEQDIVKYKVCKTLLGYMEQDKHIIYIDESGFGLDMHPEYSYARRGCRLYRIGQSKSKRLNLIMGITNQNVFAYQIRKGAHNEHSFISFILDITRKAYELGPDYVNNVVLFMDNARFHRSTLVRKLMSLLPFPILFNAPCWCELNPIEMVFWNCEEKIKETGFYQHVRIGFWKLIRELLANGIYGEANSLEGNLLLKCLMRVLFFLEKGLRGMVEKAGRNSA